jgi:hypothetical protein
VTLEFSGGEKVLYECLIQVDPTTLKISANRLYITPTRLVFDLERPLSVEISEIVELSLERFYGEKYVRVKYKNLSGVNTISFVCAGFGGVISNIARTIFVHRLISRLREGMHPRDVRLMLSKASIEFYTPWMLLALMIAVPSIALLTPVDCWSRFLLGFALVMAFTGFALTEVFRVLLAGFRWHGYLTVMAIMFVALSALYIDCSTYEIMYGATVRDKVMMENGGVWHCLSVESPVGADIVCASKADWEQYMVGDRIVVYYMENLLGSTINPYKYDDRGPDYVISHKNQ